MRQQEQHTTKYKLSGGKNVALIINSKSCSAEWPYWPPEAFLSLQHHPLYSTIVSSRHHHIGMSYTYILDTYNLIWGKVGSHFHVALALLHTYHFWAHFSFQVQCQKTTRRALGSPKQWQSALIWYRNDPKSAFEVLNDLRESSWIIRCIWPGPKWIGVNFQTMYAWFERE